MTRNPSETKEKLLNAFDELLDEQAAREPLDPPARRVEGA